MAFLGSSLFRCLPGTGWACSQQKSSSERGGVRGRGRRVGRERLGLVVCGFGFRIPSWGNCNALSCLL